MIQSVPHHKGVGDIRIRALHMMLGFDARSEEQTKFLKRLGSIRTRGFDPVLQGELVERHTFQLEATWAKSVLDKQGTGSAKCVLNSLAQKLAERIEDTVIDENVVPRALEAADVLNANQYPLNRATHDSFPCIIAGWPVWREDRARLALIPEWWGGYMSDVLENAIVGCALPRVSVVSCSLKSTWEDYLLCLKLDIEIAVSYPTTYTLVTNYSAWDKRAVEGTP